MKKKSILALGLAALAIVSGYGGMKAYQSNPDDVDLLMEEVEAMSQSENHSGFTKICNVPADPVWCKTHYQFKWTYTKEVTTYGTCVCTAHDKDCCKSSI